MTSSEIDYLEEDLSRIDQPLLSKSASSKKIKTDYILFSRDVEATSNEESSLLNSPVKRDITIEGYKNSFEDLMKSNFEKSAFEKSPTTTRSNTKRIGKTNPRRSIAFQSDDYS